MVKRAEMLIRKYPDNINNAEIYRMTGEKAYADGNYTKAIDNLKKIRKPVPTGAPKRHVLPRHQLLENR